MADLDPCPCGQPGVLFLVATPTVMRVYVGAAARRTAAERAAAKRPTGGGPVCLGCVVQAVTRLANAAQVASRRRVSPVTDAIVADAVGRYRAGGVSFHSEAR